MHLPPGQGQMYYRTSLYYRFREPAPDKFVDYGCVMHKLILRAFPKHFAADSVYAHFPFVVPEGNRVILARLGSDASYSFEAAPGRPVEPTILGLTALAGVASPQGSPIELTRTLESSRPMLQTALGQLKRTVSRSTDSICEGPVEIDLVEEVMAPYFADAFCSYFSLTSSSTKYDGLLSSEVWQAMRSIHEPACNLDPVASMTLKREARDAVEKLRVRYIAAKKARMRRSLRERLLGRYQDSQDVDHSVCPAIKVVAYQLLNLQQILVECTEYFLRDGRIHIPNIQQLSAELYSDDTGRAREAAVRIHHYILEGYRLYLAADGRSFWRETTNSGHDFINVSAAAKNNDLYPNASTLALDRDLESYQKVGLGKDQLELLNTQPIMMLFLELATFSRWKVLDGCHGLPRRINMPSHHWGAIFKDDLEDISEGDWELIERHGGFEDDNWNIVSKGGYRNSNCDVVETWKLRAKGEVTMYVNKADGKLSNIPCCFPVAWN